MSLTSTLPLTPLLPAPPPSSPTSPTPTHAPPHPHHTPRYNPIKTIKTNFLGTMNMLGLAKRTRARFLISSTSEVYGDPVEHPQTEAYWGNVNPIGERSCYDEGKRAAECLTMDYHREHGLEVGGGLLWAAARVCGCRRHCQGVSGARVSLPVPLAEPLWHGCMHNRQHSVLTGRLLRQAQHASSGIG